MKIPWQIDNNWSLFLDRDGTINTRLEGDYISDWKDFQFIEGAIDAMTIFNKYFNRIFVVTNQQGIGKELMTHEQLSAVHDKMIEEIAEQGAHVDQIYYCPELAIYNPLCRKPNPGMAFQAQADFPDIKFRQSIMIGDQPSDIDFGKRLEMRTVGLSNGNHRDLSNGLFKPDLVFRTLWEFAECLLDSKPF